MGRCINYTVKTVRCTGYGSDYYGNCEVCGRHMSEACVHETHTLYVDSDGDIYLGSSTPAIYAHTSCMLAYQGAKVVSKESLTRKGRLYIYPIGALLNDLIAAGFSEDGAKNVIMEAINPQLQQQA